MSILILTAVATLTACGPADKVLSAPTTVSTPATLQVLGNGLDTTRYQAEIAVRGTLAYTTTWGARHAVGNKVNIWDVSGSVPVLIDSLLVPGATTTGDVDVSDDGQLLVVATEYAPGTIAIYSLADPRHPSLLDQFSNDQTYGGVHTAELGRVNGKLYAFLCIDPTGNTNPARLVIVDLSVPTAPRQVSGLFCTASSETARRSRQAWSRQAR